MRMIYFKYFGKLTFVSSHSFKRNRSLIRKKKLRIYIYTHTLIPPKQSCVTTEKISNPIFGDSQGLIQAYYCLWKVAH